MEADQELIQNFLDGDEQAFNLLVRKYQSKVVNLCYRYLGEKAEAEDVAQEVFVTIYKALKKFRGDSQLSTWIFRITVNHCKNRLKYLGRRSYFSSTSLDQSVETEDGELSYELSDDNPNPEETLISSHVQDTVQQAIESLDPDHRAILVLRDIQELSYQEIAEILDLKEGTVKSRIHRARLELKQVLEQMMEI